MKIYLIFLLLLKKSYSLNYLYLNQGNKQGVENCPDVITPNTPTGEPHDAIIYSYSVQTTCLPDTRCCYIKHCPNGICTAFCLYRPYDKYFTSNYCPPYGNTDLWYVPMPNNPTVIPTQTTCIKEWNQCNNNCCNPLSCIYKNQWYSQCEFIDIGTCQRRWNQCNGKNWNGFKCCNNGMKCNYINEWYSQCNL
jgi:hypothetical protein